MDSSYERTHFLDPALLRPPPPCHKRKERQQWARFIAVNALMIRNRNRNNHLNVSTQMIEKIDTREATDTYKIFCVDSDLFETPGFIYNETDKQRVIQAGSKRLSKDDVRVQVMQYEKRMFSKLDRLGF